MIQPSYHNNRDLDYGDGDEALIHAFRLLEVPVARDVSVLLHFCVGLQRFSDTVCGLVGALEVLLLE